MTCGIKVVPCFTPQQRRTKETYKRDVQKRPTKKTYKTTKETHKRCRGTWRAFWKWFPVSSHNVWGKDISTETLKKDLQKRPKEETYKTYLQKTPTKETYKRDLQKRPTKEAETLQTGFPVLIKKTYQKRPLHTKRDQQMRPTKEAYQRDTLWWSVRCKAVSFHTHVRVCTNVRTT